MLEIPLEQAQRFILDVQGLKTSKPSKSILSVAKRIHNIQIDTISVVSRSHNLIIFNRLNSYKEGDLWQLEKKGSLFEHWSHGICLMPIESYPFYAWRMKQFRELKGHRFHRWATDNKQLVEEVLKHVKNNGATPSVELGKREKKGEGWWDWKSEKYALEYLFMIGELMVPYRKGFQKYYDLTERVLPSKIPSEPMADEEVPRFVVETTFSALGLCKYKELRLYLGRRPSITLWNNQKNKIEDYLESLVDESVLVEVQISGHPDRYFVLKSNLNRLKHSARSNGENEAVKLLSPFDNVVRDRHYPKDLWKFDYALESYTPKSKRKYGYYVLPILYGIKLVGRTDAKSNRKDSIMEFKSLYLEDEFWKDEKGLERLVSGLLSFASFHKCNRTIFNKVVPARAKLLLKNCIRQ